MVYKTRRKHIIKYNKSKKRKKNKKRCNRTNKKKYNRTIKKGGNPDIIKKYLSNLVNEPLDNCNYDDSCKKPSSKSGQEIRICDKSVYKAPPFDKSKYTNRIEQVDNYANTIKISAFNMNLLIQSIINVLPDNIKENVEHYDDLCMNDDNYMMKSMRMGYEIDGKIYNTLEEYILNIPTIDINLITKWLEQVCYTLDKLYNTIQFHHCDTKSAQILLDGNGNAIVGDLDKVTFTLIINDIPKRIRLTRLPYSGRLLNRFSKLPQIFGMLTKIERMRFENEPRDSAELEKTGFICSAAILCPTLEKANELIKNTQHLYKDHIINISKNYLKLSVKKRKRHKYSTYYVKPLNKPIFVDLNSDVKLTLIDDDNFKVEYIPSTKTSTQHSKKLTAGIINFDGIEVPPHPY